MDEFQKVVLWANETQIPLVPVSSGGIHFRGNTCPTAPGAIMVDLCGMDRILKIDRRNQLALTEPGVTYTELQLVRAVHRSPLLSRMKIGDSSLGFILIPNWG